MPSYDISYTYDVVGNRLTNTDNLTSAITTSTYDAANRLETAVDASGTTSYTYDAVGNLTKIEDPGSNVTSYTWDADNMRTKVEFPSGEVVTSTYDGDHLRVKREDAIETKKFVWDGHNYLLETDENDQITVTYSQQPEGADSFSKLISQRRKDGAGWVTDYFHYDALGSTLNLTHAGEVVEETYLYDAWGNLLSSNTLQPAFLYIGELGYFSDWSSGELHDYYLRMRTYSPTISRFLSQDPLGIRTTLNLFTYADGNPITAIDPSGLYKTYDGRRGCWGKARRLEYITNRGSFSTTGRTSVSSARTALRGGAAAADYVGISVQIQWDVNNANFTQNERYVHSRPEGDTWVRDRGCCCCDRVWFTQIAETTIKHHNDPVLDWLRSIELGVDPPDNYYYPFGDQVRSAAVPCKGDPDIRLGDEPGTAISVLGLITRYDFKAETCVVCLNGNEGPAGSWRFRRPRSHEHTLNAIATYGCIKWGFSARHRGPFDFISQWNATTGDYYFRAYMGEWDSNRLKFFNTAGHNFYLSMDARDIRLRSRPGAPIPGSVGLRTASMPPSGEFDSTVIGHTFKRHPADRGFPWRP